MEIDLEGLRATVEGYRPDSPVILLRETVLALLAALDEADQRAAALEAERDELRNEAEIFDESHADQNRMVDRIADLIGLPHDVEMDTVAFELWFSQAFPTDAGNAGSGDG